MTISISRTGKVLSAIAVAVLFVLVTSTGSFAVPSENGVKKVFVCKYVGTPEVNERLQTGQNPISVSVNSIKDYKGVDSWFNDAQGRSYVIAEDNGQEAPDCKSTGNEENYYFQFAKKWAGDTIDTTNVKVVFTADNDFSWTLGDPAVEVVPGETTLTNVKEVVTGLPANCKSTSDVPSTITAPETGYDEDNLFTLTVTNTVTCEEGTVAGAVTTPPAQVAVTPVGAADAGGAGTAAFVGLVGSTLAVSLGAVIRKFSL